MLARVIKDRAMSQDVTGTSLVSQTNEVVLFIPPTPRTPTKLRLDGSRILISDEQGVISDETYGPLTIERLVGNKTSFVVEMQASGQHGRALTLPLEA